MSRSDRIRHVVEPMANSHINAPSGTVEIGDTVRKAVALHRLGRLDEAEGFYREALSLQADNFDALHLCGVLMHQRGDHAEALRLIGRALRTNERSAEAYSNYGIVLALLGKHEDAVGNYDRALALKPDFAEALNNRGNSLRALKRPQEAVMSFERAIAARTDYAEAFNNRGNALFEIGRIEDALASYDRALALHPSFADASINRANALRTLGRNEEALRAFDLGIELKPDHAGNHLARGNVLLDLKRPADAEKSYERAIALNRQAIEPLVNRGRALCALKRFDESIESYDQALAIRQNDAVCLVGRGNTKHAMQAYAAALADYDLAIAVRPEFAEAHGNRGNALREIGRHREALEAFDRALALKPDYDEAYNNRGNALIELNRPAEALADYDRAIAISPENTYAWVNRGSALGYLDRTEEAIASFERAIELDPQLVEAHWNKALIFLSTGDFARGWAGYERRWQRDGETIPREFVQPQWRGEDLTGRTILLHAEQGFGDSIQFIRYLSMVAARGGKIVLELPDSLVPLIDSVDAVISICRRGDALPHFDVHCPLLSLPLAFGTTLETVPAPLPYLRPPAERVQDWRARLAGIRKPRVGLVWSGKPTHKNDHNRSIALSRLEPLLSVPGIEFVSLQREYRDSDGPAIARLPLMRLDDALRDFADTAAVIAELDLVISVDTAVAHLAGAMGRPLWLLLSHIQDWRWLRARSDSPWYPTARLFRQPSDGNWDDVIARVLEELSAFAIDWSAATK
jgi:tetratricopeptide (TPR) repeat protein